MRKQVVERARAAFFARQEELLARRESELASEQALLEAREPDCAETMSEHLLASYLDGQTELEQHELQSIVDALVRMDAGSWGRCVRCGDPIGEARLLARPTAETCIGCGIGEEMRHFAAGSRSVLERPRPGSEALMSPPEDRGVYRPLFGPADRALEEPDLMPPAPSFDWTTARPNDRGGQAIDYPATVEPEDLARVVLQEVTEAEVHAQDAEPLVDEQLRYRPDEFFPDRVSWPLDEIDADEEIQARGPEIETRRPIPMTRAKRRIEK